MTTQPDRQLLLRRALTGNAISCLSFGATMALAPAWVCGLLGVEATLAVRLIGVGLILVAADFGHQTFAASMSTTRARLAVLGDAGWVLASAVLLIGWSASFSSLGIALVTVVALMVAGFALAQALGLRRMNSVR